MKDGGGSINAAGIISLLENNGISITAACGSVEVS